MRQNQSLGRSRVGVGVTVGVGVCVGLGVGFVVWVVLKVGVV